MSSRASKRIKTSEIYVLPLGDIGSYHPASRSLKSCEVTLMIKKIGLMVLLATLSGAASARGPVETCTTKYLFFGLISYQSCPHTGGGTVSAPEIDPASAMAGLTLLMGGLAVLRGRRFNNTKA